MKKVGIFGCKSTTQFLVDSLCNEVNISNVITITPEQGTKAQVADYCNMQNYCQLKNIPCYQANKYSLNDEEDYRNILKMKLDIAFVIGWQRLIPKQILDTLSIGVFGMHGSADDLPIGRGRSPMNWALIEQRKHFYTNLFKYDCGVDSGDILDTFVFSIQQGDTAETMHFKNMMAMRYLILRNLENLFSGRFELKKQREATPTYYPKRNPEDGLIDWNRDIYQIEAFIRGVTHPFAGAFTYANQEKVTILRAAIFETDIVDFGYRGQEYGTIIDIFPNGKFLVKCRGGILIIHEYETSAILKSAVKLNSPDNSFHYFTINKYGYHDTENE